MISDAKTHFRNPHMIEVVMSSANVLRFSENFDTMTEPECLSFIKRSRRQIDRQRAVGTN